MLIFFSSSSAEPWPVFAQLLYLLEWHWPHVSAPANSGEGPEMRKNPCCESRGVNTFMTVGMVGTLFQESPVPKEGHHCSSYGPAKPVQSTLTWLFVVLWTLVITGRGKMPPGERNGTSGFHSVWAGADPAARRLRQIRASRAENARPKAEFGSPSGSNFDLFIGRISISFSGKCSREPPARHPPRRLGRTVKLPDRPYRSIWKSTGAGLALGKFNRPLAEGSWQAMRQKTVEGRIS